MHPDIVGLRSFYGTRLGRHVRAVIAGYIRQRWQHTRDDVILGLGYATPWLRLLLREVGAGGTVLAAMPRAQGGMYWPSRGDNRTVLVHKHALPLPPNSVHRALVIHALEFAEDPHACLRELARVLTPGGRVLLVVPHRRSVWSAAQATPMGYGMPYSVGQMRHACEDSGLTLIECNAALRALPSQWKPLLKLASLWEWLGHAMPWMGGVLIAELEKQVYAGVREHKTRRAQATVWVPAGVASSRLREAGGGSPVAASRRREC